jgi:glucosylceramidase
MGHISRFVIPQSVRIGWTSDAGNNNPLQVLAAETPEGNTAVVVLNTNDSPIKYKLQDQGQAAFGMIPAHSIQTLIFDTEISA